MKDENELTEKQQLFIAEYLIDLNATQAAIRAGYSAKTAGQAGARLLKDVKIERSIAEAMAQRSMRTQVTVDRVLEEYARLGFSDIRKAIEWRTISVIDPEDENAEQRHAVDVRFKDSDLLGTDTAAAISEVSVTDTGTVKLKFHDKKGALDSMAKHLGLLVDKSEVSVIIKHEDRLARVRERLNARATNPSTPTAH